ncbi:hypothetical protein CEXT_141331 [Caerostris extrusa]|uniref:Uncharacterized protein n=1 Tax=Caerostris extrusa TaxID=172846 RepID=A0AAV4WCW5_CAEEX|nr:hypothetical protein CEXT_141331 [Caerostris extrusa]
MNNNKCSFKYYKFIFRFSISPHKKMQNSNSFRSYRFPVHHTIFDINHNVLDNNKTFIQILKSTHHHHNISSVNLTLQFRPPDLTHSPELRGNGPGFSKQEGSA